MQEHIKFHPILFSTPMVQALLEGRKTQTRRVVNPTPEEMHFVSAVQFDYTAVTLDRCISVRGYKNLSSESGPERRYVENNLRCPYGKRGDVLWVRESFAYVLIGVKYKADGDWDNEEKKMGMAKPWRPSIHMPKAACRLFLQIESIRVERLEDISETDAMAEGAKPESCLEPVSCNHPYYHGFSRLWQTINGAESWDANPWVWVIAFKRTTKPENFL